MTNCYTSIEKNIILYIFTDLNDLVLNSKQFFFTIDHEYLLVCSSKNTKTKRHIPILNSNKTKGRVPFVYNDSNIT